MFFDSVRVEQLCYRFHYMIKPFQWVNTFTEISERNLQIVSKYSTVAIANIVWIDSLLEDFPNTFQGTTNVNTWQYKPWHNDFCSPLLLCRHYRRFNLICRQKPVISEGTVSSRTDINFHQLYLGFEVFVKLYLVWHDDFTLLDEFNQPLCIRKPFDQSSCLVQPWYNWFHITHGC